MHTQAQATADVLTLDQGLYRDHALQGLICINALIVATTSLAGLGD